jgi:hypothetical protein
MFQVTRPTGTLPLLAGVALIAMLGACDAAETTAVLEPAERQPAAPATANPKPEAPGPAQQVGAKIDQAVAAASAKLESLMKEHGPKVEEVKAATEEGVRKLTGTVGEKLEQAGQKAQEVAQEPKEK